jgi:fluoride exporter
MRLLLLATAGGAIGAGARYLVNMAALRLLGPAFPWATLTVNIVGSAAMGLLLAVIDMRYGGSLQLRTFLLTGILGGFTTFSAFSMDAAALWDRGASGLAIAYIIGSVVVSILAFYGGALLARQVLS